MDAPLTEEDLKTTHRFVRVWHDLGPFTVYEAVPLTATQEWQSEIYFVALQHQARWLSRESYPSLAAALRAMATYLESR